MLVSTNGNNGNNTLARRPANVDEDGFETFRRLAKGKVDAVLARDSDKIKTVFKAGTDACVEKHVPHAPDFCKNGITAVCPKPVAPIANQALDSCVTSTSKAVGHNAVDGFVNNQSKKIAYGTIDGSVDLAKRACKK